MFCEDMFCGRDGQKEVARQIPDLKTKKRHRTAFSTAQLNFLEQEYKICPYSEHARLCKIASMVNKPEKVVKVWFQNRRSREKKMKEIKKNIDEKSELDIPGTQWRTSPIHPAQSNFKSESHINNLIPMTNHPIIDLTKPVGSNSSEHKAQIRTKGQNMKLTKSHIESNIKCPANRESRQTKTKCQINKIIENKVNQTFEMLNKQCKNVTCNSNMFNTKPSMKINETKQEITLNNKHIQNFRNLYNNKGQSASTLCNTNNSSLTSNHYFSLNSAPSAVDRKNIMRFQDGLSRNDYGHDDANKIQDRAKVKQQKCSCNCVSRQEGGQTRPSYKHIPYVVIIPCFK